MFFILILISDCLWILGPCTNFIDQVGSTPLKDVKVESFYSDFDIILLPNS